MVVFVMYDLVCLKDRNRIVRVLENFTFIRLQQSFYMARMTSNKYDRLVIKIKESITLEEKSKITILKGGETIEKTFIMYGEEMKEKLSLELDPNKILFI